VLAEHCRGLRYYLEAGLTLVQAMKNQGTKGPPAVRSAATVMAKRLAHGDSFAEVLADQTHLFPPIYRTLANVAEETGKLPEALRELEKYFQLQQKLWRDFISQITWPVVQYVLAVLVIAGLMYILGEILPTNPINVLGMKGAGAALAFIGGNVFVVALIFGGYWFVSNVIKKGGVVDSFLLRIPYVGGCLEALALSRFSLAMGIMVDAGTPIGDAAKLGLTATSNHAYADRAEPASKLIKNGETLTEALRAQRLFPSDFLDMVETAEEGGREGDAFSRLADQYYETAQRRMKALTAVAGWLVWLIVAIFIIVLIFSIYGQYFNQLNQLAG
jgi:type IV pilus assembly protein PilC